MHGGLSPELQHFDQAPNSVVARCGSGNGTEMFQGESQSQNRKRGSIKHKEARHGSRADPSLFQISKSNLLLLRRLCLPSPPGGGLAPGAQIRKIVRPTDVPDSGLVCDLPGAQTSPRRRVRAGGAAGAAFGGPKGPGEVISCVVYIYIIIYILYITLYIYSDCIYLGC